MRKLRGRIGWAPGFADIRRGVNMPGASLTALFCVIEDEVDD